MMSPQEKVETLLELAAKRLEVESTVATETPASEASPSEVCDTAYQRSVVDATDAKTIETLQAPKCQEPVIVETTSSCRTLSAPLNVQETVVDVDYCEDHAIEVEVGVKTIHRVTKHVPKYVEKEIEVMVEVPEVHHTQELRVQEEWKHEEINHEITTTTISEVLSPRAKVVKQRQEEEVDVEVEIPLGERIVERPNVQVEEKITYVKGKHVAVEEPMSIVEDPYTLHKPRVVLAPTVKHELAVKEVFVKHVEQTVNVKEVAQRQTVENIFEVPEHHTEKAIKYVPSFVQEQTNTTREFEKLEQLDQALKEAQASLIQQEKEKVQLRAALSEILVDLSAKRQEVDDAKVGNRKLEQQIKTADMLRR